jgi:transcriptional regulator PpsR
MNLAVAAQPDVTLFLDRDGVIREAAFSNTVSNEDAASWVGKRWIETVADAGASKVERLVADAGSRRVSAFRQIPQRFPSGVELLMEYTAVRLGPRAGLVAVGKSLQSVAALQASVIAAQQAVERDYWRLRNVETRYRLLFNAAAEASLMVEASSLRILEANAAALAALRPAREPGRIEGGDLAAEFHAGDRAALLAMLHRVREHGGAPGVLARLARDEAPFTVRASLLKSEPSAVFLLQLAPVGSAPPRAAAGVRLSAESMMERHPYGFALLAADGRVLGANRAFLELVEIGAESWVVGERLSRWAAGAEAQLSRMIQQARETGLARSFAATVLGQMGGRRAVEITASTAAGDSEHVFVLLRPADGDETLQHIAGGFGRVALEQSLREVAAAVERQCIEKALELRQGDAAAAAAVLGISLRSLRARMRTLGRSEHA